MARTPAVHLPDCPNPAFPPLPPPISPVPASVRQSTRRQAATAVEIPATVRWNRVLSSDRGRRLCHDGLEAPLSDDRGRNSRHGAVESSVWTDRGRKSGHGGWRRAIFTGPWQDFLPRSPKSASPTSPWQTPIPSDGGRLREIVGTATIPHTGILPRWPRQSMQTPTVARIPATVSQNRPLPGTVAENPATVDEEGLLPQDRGKESRHSRREQPVSE